MLAMIMFLFSCIATGFNVTAESYGWAAVMALLSLYWLVQIAKDEDF